MWNRPGQRNRIFFGAAITLIAVFLALGFSNFAGAQQPQDLEALKRQMRPVLEIPGVVFTDADEATGRLVVGVENRGLRTSVEARLAALRVPMQLVEIRETKPIVFMGLQDRSRPTMGGLQIYFVKFPWAYVCTLGFNAKMGNVSGFVTNSHCTKTRGAVDGMQHFQPSSGSGNLIGTEIADPPLFTGGECPANRQCRYSDAVFDRSEIADSEWDLGKIARTTGPNNGSLDVVGQFNVVAEAPTNATEGQSLNKVGRTTGWTAGAVVGTCIDTNVSGSKLTMLCQDWVDAGVGGGDSGSPVFGDISGSDVQLYGILWGGSSDGTLFVYSPIANIQMSSELGQLQTYTGETGQATPTQTPTPTTAATLTPTSTSTAPTSTPPPPTATQPPNGISLSAVGYKTKGVHTVDITWSGASGSSVQIHRNGELIATPVNDGSYTDNTGNKGGNTSYTYEVCDSSGCSNQVVVNF